MESTVLGLGSVMLIVVIFYVPVFYRMSRRISQLEDELREVRQELRKSLN